MKLAAAAPRGRERPADMAPREKAREIIFGHETTAGRAFDLALMIAIALSVAVVMLDSVQSISAVHHTSLLAAEWAFTILFTIEYLLRLWCAGNRREYAFSFFGIVDLLAILPTWLAAVLPYGPFLLVIRILRILRIFRILKLVQFMGEASTLGAALRASRHKITVFVFSVLTVVVVIGAVMFIVEGPEAGFTSIPESMYWAIVTMTTVGYGDITPMTPLGKFLATALMILGYGIIAVPTGIVTVELQRSASPQDGRTCPSCGRDRHETAASFCASCGAALGSGKRPPEVL